LTSVLEGGEGSKSRPGRTLPPGKDPVPIVQEAVWASGTVWTGAESLAPIGIRSPDRSACRQLTIYYQQSPSWEANRSSACQEIHQLCGTW